MYHLFKICPILPSVKFQGRFEIFEKFINISMLFCCQISASRMSQKFSAIVFLRPRRLTSWDLRLGLS